MNKLICGVLLIVITGSLSSCSLFKRRSRKKAKAENTVAIQDTTKPKTDTVVAAAVQNTVTPPAHEEPVANNMHVNPLIADLSPVWANRLQYKTFAGKAKVKYQGPDNSSDFTANFRVRKDSVIWIEISALGGLFRVRVLITPDTMYMINYIQREVTILPLNMTAKLLPAKVDFSSLQNLVTGEPLRSGTITKAESDAANWLLQVEDTSYIQQITYSKADTTISKSKLLTRKAGGPEANSDYTNYELIDNRKIAKSRVLKIQNGQDAYEVEMNFVKAEFDTQLDFPFSIPKNFGRK